MCELTISQKHIITERNNSKGEYQPAFMQIRIHNSFDGNIDELDAVSYTHLDVYKRQALF